MRDSRLYDFPWILALLGVTLAGCAEVGYDRETARNVEKMVILIRY